MALNNTYLTMQSYNKNDVKFNKGIDYAYALTIHKSQGSTYKDVYIDVKDIRNSTKTRSLALRLLYTALSRPTNKALLLF